MALLTIIQTAERLNVSTTTVRALIASGDLEAVRVARCVRIDPAAIAVYLEHARIEPPRSCEHRRPKPRRSNWREQWEAMKAK